MVLGEALGRRRGCDVRGVRQLLGGMLLTMLACAELAHAQPTIGPQPGAGAAPARSELQWLQAIQAAAQRLNYSGTVIYQQGEEVRASRLIHVFDGHISHERLQPMDGRPREFIRRADEVQCLMPESRRIVIERRAAQDTFPAIATTEPAEILEHYTVRLGEVERVAGIESQIIHIEPKDRLRYGYRLWVDRSSGLLLRALTLNERNEVLEQMAFAEVRIGERIDKSQLKPAWSTEGWRIERTEQPSIELARYGWHVAAPSGFHKLREVMRSLWGQSTERKAMQAIYTDGLASVSVFIEPASPETVVETGQSNGPTSVYARRVADARVTVVGEVPMTTVKSLAQSVEFRATR